MLIKMDNGTFTRIGDPGEPCSGVPRRSVTEAEAEWIANLCIDKIVLEIGTGTGYSTQCIADVADCVVTIDPDPWVHGNVWPILSGNVIPISGANLTLSRIFEVVFIDGDHALESIMSDIALARSCVKSEGVIIFHDYKIADVAMAIEASGLFIHEILESVCGVACTREVKR